jgi:uncharacterized membrane protein
VIWLNHHRLFEQMRGIDRKLLLDLNLLMWITLVPFPRPSSPKHLQDVGEATTTANAVFSATLFVTSIGFNAPYAWITHDDRLIHTPPSRRGSGSHPVRAGAGRTWAAVGVASSRPTQPWGSMR